MAIMYKQTDLKHKDSDALRRANYDPKCSLNDSSGDSGFISNENLLVSCEIASGELQPITENVAPSTLDSGAVKKEEKDICCSCVDSGILDSFSSLNVNDSTKETHTESHQKSKLENQRPATKIVYPLNLYSYYKQNDDGETYLHIAIAEGFVDVALALIKAAPHPRLLDTPNDKAETPLHFAVATTQWRIARWLRVAGARPCPRNLKGDSPLHVAARMGDVKSIKAITDPVEKQERDALGLSYKGHIYQTCNLDQWNYLGETCVHLAALNGHVEVLRQLLWQGADINAREGCTGYTALHYAVRRKDEATVQFLLQFDELDIEMETYGGQNALDIVPILPSGISKALKKRGVTPVFFSDDDYEETDSEDSGD